MKSIAAFVAALALMPSSALAQRAADPRAAALVATDPIRCWWRSDAGAITIGQPFSLMLTCAVIDTDTVQVVPDESRLGVATVQVAPFEILGGSHPADARDGARRFFQYQYTLRIIDRDVIGRDVNIPSLAIQYRVRSRVNAASTLEGRDLTYVMPALPIKVMSLVPAEATDIRDASDIGFGAAAALHFRASVFRIAAAGLAAFAVIVAVWAVGPWARMARKTSPDAPHRIPDRVVLADVRAALAEVKAEANREWTDDLIARALTLHRVVAALAIDRRISQQPIAAGGRSDARVPITWGRVQPRRATVASPVTTADVDQVLNDLDGRHATRAELEALRDGLRALTDAAYRDGDRPDTRRLDEAVQSAIAAAERIRNERSRMNEWIDSMRRTVRQKAARS